MNEDGKIISRYPNKDELDNLQEESYQKKRNRKYTNEQLLNYLIEFEKKNGRMPVDDDFNNNFKYPSVWNYHDRFGGWTNALRLAGLLQSVQFYSFVPTSKTPSICTITRIFTIGEIYMFRNSSIFPVKLSQIF